jgi:hypothetical protein
VSGTLFGGSTLFGGAVFGVKRGSFFESGQEVGNYIYLFLSKENVVNSA